MQDRTSTSGDEANRPLDAAGSPRPADQPAELGATDPAAIDPAAPGTDPASTDPASTDPGPLYPSSTDPGPDLPPPDQGDPLAAPGADPLYPGAPVGVAADPYGDPAPAATADTHAADTHDHDEADDDEPGRRSFAARVLTWLVLLIAGGALALWGAPRLAPHLPSGMAPVAAWLTPGQNAAEARIAALEAETEAEIAALRSELAAAAETAPDTSALDARFAEVETGVAERIDALTEEFGALEGAGGGERLARLEAALDGQEAALASLREQLSGVDDVEGVTAQIDVYQSDLEGLRAEVRELAGQVGSLSGRLEEVAAAASRQVAAAEARVAEVEAQSQAALSSAEREAALAQIRSALTAGAPYAEATERLAEDPDFALPDGLAAPAETGVPTLATLRDTFPDAAHEAIRATIMARAGDGVLERARAFAEAQVASRSLTPQPGPSPDAILSRMEEALRQDDLAAALSEAEALPPEASDAMAGWLDGARARATALADYQALEAEFSATN